MLRLNIILIRKIFTALLELNSSISSGNISSLFTWTHKLVCVPSGQADADCSDVKRGKVETPFCSNIPRAYLLRKLYWPAAHTLEYKLSRAVRTQSSSYTLQYTIYSRSAASMAC